MTIIATLRDILLLRRRFNPITRSRASATITPPLPLRGRGYGVRGRGA